MLVTGLAAVDFIIVCDHYPREDEKGKALSHHKQRGGNAANVAEIIARHGTNVELFCYLEKGENGDFVTEQCKQYRVSTKNCIFSDAKGFPTTYCILSKEKNTRTSLHSRSPAYEPKCDDFLRIFGEVFCQYSWLHFEGRSFPDICNIVQFLHRKKAITEGNSFPVVSAELERVKSKDELLQGVLPYVNVVFISKDFAKCIGYDDAEQAVRNIKSDYRLPNDRVIVVPDGERGAHAVDGHNVYHHCNAMPPRLVVDTNGAGDCFIAAVIHSLNTGESMATALKAGCNIAGRKCGIFGFKDLLP